MLKHLSLLFIISLINSVSCGCEDAYVTICPSIEDLLTEPGRFQYFDLMIQDECSVERRQYLLRKTDLSIMPYVQRIVILNQLNGIEPFSFEGLLTIQYLILYGNNLDVIKPNTFHELKTLKKLDLRNNHIREMMSSSVKSCHISLADLSYNELTRLESDTFRDSNITKLVITHNRLTRIERDALPNAVKQLILDYNNFEYFSLADLKKANVIEELSLSHNKLYTIQPFHPSGKLKTLDVSFNKLYLFSFDNVMSSDLEQIKFISLAYNRLRSLILDNVKFNKCEIALRGNPWNCKCVNRLIQIIANSSYGVVQESCDRKIAETGSIPFCLEGIHSSRDVCPTIEIIPQEFYDLFQTMLNERKKC